MATRADLTDFLREKTRCTWHDADRFASLTVDWLAQTIAGGERIELRGLGTFYTVARPERKSTLPTAKKVPAQLKVKFKPGRFLKKGLALTTRSRKREFQRESP